MDTNIVLNQIGNTPLVRLKQASELTVAIFMERLNISILESLLKIELPYLLFKMQLKEN